MKKVNFYVLATCALALTACGGMNKMAKMANEVQWDVTPKVLEMHGDSVEMEITVTFPPKYFQKAAILELTPVLKYEGGEKAFESKAVQGESVQANNEVCSFANGGTFKTKSKIAFEEAMRSSELIARVKATMKDKSQDLPEQKIADGVMSTALLLDKNAMTIGAADKFERITNDSKGATLFFVINKADIQSKELKKDEVAALKQFISDVAANERMEVKGIEISAFASPDGEESLNDKLAASRMKNSDSFFKKELKKSKVSADESVFKTTSLAEDWDGFKTLMQESDIQDKELILRVLSMYSDPVVREKEIKNISAAYEEIADKILPQLRRSTLSVNVAVIGHSDDEIKELIAANSEDLTVEELLYAATLTEDNAEKLSIYQKAAAKYPEDWRTNNNVGHISYKMGNIAEAKAAFEKAKEADASNTVVLNNLGACAYAEGDEAAAKEFYNAAAGAGDEVSYNQAVIATKKGDYESALNLYQSSKMNSFNWALCKYLNYFSTKNADVFDATLGILNKIEDQDNAKIPYLKAVIAARKQDKDLLINSLKVAVEKDASLGAYAAKDIEFAQYAQDEDFKNIAK
jgi:tetratricopeptide (TPR) repeat protein